MMGQIQGRFKPEMFILAASESYKCTTFRVDTGNVQTVTDRYITWHLILTATKNIQYLMMKTVTL